MAKGIMAQVAEEFAEQKVMASSAEGVDPELMKALWKANALEVLAFAMPRLGIEDQSTDSAESQAG